MAQRVCIIGGGVIGLATAYALVRDGFEVTVIEARDALGSETSFANGGQLSYRYVAPLADAGVPLQAIGWMLRGDSPLKLRPRFDAAQWRWMASFLGACRRSVNRDERRTLAAAGAVQSRHIEGMARRRWAGRLPMAAQRQTGDLPGARQLRACTPAAGRPSAATGAVGGRVRST